MAQDGAHYWIVAEIYYQPPMSGYRGGRRVRPVHGERFPTDMNVECSKAIREKYALGTRLRMRVKLTDKEGGREFLMADRMSNYPLVGPDK